MRRNLFLLCLLYSSFVFSQNTNLSSWYMYFANAKINESPFAIHFELQNRNHFILKDLDQFLGRTGLQYNYSDQAAFTVGYAFVQSEMIGDIDMPKIENRIYQEALLGQKINYFSVRHRFRYEQRFIEGVDFKTRYRYSLAINFPLYQNEVGRNLYAAVYNELFIHGEKKTETDELFDRNRLYLGAGLKLNPKFSFQVGWMNQIFKNYSQPKLMVSLHHNLSI
jgi:hypothetical protein